MNEHNSLPVLDRLSIISAIILLTYSVTSFVNLPEVEWETNLLGVVWAFRFDLKTYISIIVPVFAAVGAYWLIGTHPAHSKDRYPLQHSILPTLTAWVIGLPLTQLPNNSMRWIIFALGGIMLIVVLAAEYIVVDIYSERHVLASGLLKALSLALFFFVAIALHAAQLRLYLLLPALTITALLVLLRTFYLQSGGKWLINWSIMISLVIGQIALGLHYLPVTPLAFGLILLGPLYALSDFASGYQQNRTLEYVWVGPTMMIIFLVLAILL